MAFTLYPWLENTHEKNVARRMWCNLELKTIVLLHVLFHVLQMETSFLFKLFAKAKQIGHCQEASRQQKWLWIIVVLPWLCLTIIGETYIHVNNLWKWIWFVIFNRIRNDCIYSMTKRWCSSLIVGVFIDYSNFKIGF